MSEEQNKGEQLPDTSSLLPEAALPIGNLPAGRQGKQMTIEPAADQTQPQTSNLEPQTDKMEVHHHGHVHNQKKWKEYLFQFIMLFLAVFCGFLAEYKLEHVIEHNREKQYIQSMIEDVEKDTAALSAVIRYQVNITPGLDSLSLQCYRFKNSYADIKNIYRLHKTSGLSTDVLIEFNDKTLSQLKNAGGMRLIRNKVAADSITLYDSRIKQIKSHESMYNDVIVNSYLLSLKLFNRNFYRQDRTNSRTSAHWRLTGNFYAE